MSRSPRRAGVPGLWAELLGFDRAHPQVADAAAVVVLLAAGAPWMVLHDRSGTTSWVFDVALLAPLVLRRRHPDASFAAIAVVAFVQWLVGQPLLADVALLAGLATVASERPRRHAVAAWATVEVGVVVASLHWSFDGSWDRSLVGLSGLAAMALLAGVVVRSRRAHLTELTERAARLELERDQQAQIAAAAERTRIAREMHDVIAHSLAVMITMADGASAKLERDPGRAGAAIEAVAAVGRQALGETRRLLGVLRDPTGAAELAPQPGLGQLEDLVEQVRDTGLDVSLRVSGATGDPSPGLGLAVYRIVQEATTNALKHAFGAHHVWVAVHLGVDGVVVEVVDDGATDRSGPGAGSRPRRQGAPAGAQGAGGHGIAGMRERVALYGGDLEVGPGPDGGWVVRATLAAPSRDRSTTGPLVAPAR